MLTGTCDECHRVTTLVEGTLPLGSGSAPPSPSPAGEPSPAAPPAVPGPECADCGSPLSVSARDDGALEVHCEECETTTVFVPEGAPPAGRRERSAPYQRAPRREFGGGEGAPRSRPCRQCGAPLTFSNDAEGNLVGECAACGNRFTLPPRTDGPRSRGGDRGGRYGDRPPPRYGRSGGKWSPPGGRSRPSYGRGSGSYGRRERSDSDDEPRRRRRRDDA